MGPFAVGEQTLAGDLWSAIPENSLTILDRGFHCANTLLDLSSRVNRHWLIRAKRNLRKRVLKKFGRGDFLIEMIISPQAKQRDPRLPNTWQARAITYQRKGFRPQLLLTSLADPERYPASEIAALYHERWELELGYDEIKTSLLDRREALRSKTPCGVRQELWGLFLAYNLVRLEMERAADEAGIEPTRISFVGALRFICDEWLWCAVALPGAIPRHLRDLRQSLVGMILPPRRSARSYPRAVKRKMSSYARAPLPKWRRLN